MTSRFQLGTASGRWWSEAVTSVLDQRQATIDGLDSRVDVVVVGGGINGVGVLLDAVSRGMSAVLVERDDLGVGTSTRSSKLIHGGLRYLEHLHFGLVREALLERDRLARLAPHLVTLRRFVVPVVGGSWQLPYIGSGLTLYDVLGGDRGGQFEAFGRQGVVTRAPVLDREAVVGGFEYTDGVCDDARVVMAVAETARLHGGRYLTRAEAVGVTRTASGWSVSVEDRLGGARLTLEARAVVDVTGAYRAGTAAFADIVPSRGTHLVVAGDRFPGLRGLTIRVPDRVVFVIPWGRRWLVGTTDVEHRGPIDRPAATGAEVDYLLETVNRVLQVDLDRHEIISTFAGIRPLVGDGAEETHSVSREHRVAHDGHGHVAIRGGKYTTYRLAAEEAVDVVARHLGIAAASSTDSVPLVGASTPTVLDEVVGRIRAAGVDEVSARWLVGRHGTAAGEVLDAGRRLDLLEPLHPEMPYLAVEAWWAIHREGALDLDDVLARRTRLAVETRDHGAAAIPLVADLLAEALYWTPDQRQSAVAAYQAGAEREYGVP